MESDDRQSYGQEMFRRVTQRDPSPISKGFAGVTMDVIFESGLWSRPGLTFKERRYIALTAAAMSGAPVAVWNHVWGALKSGDITPDEMEEYLIHFAHYAGWPHATIVSTAYRDALAKLKSSKQEQE